jgi:GAF domain
MGERRHGRVKMVFPVRVCGTDAEGKPFSFLAHTLDFSRSGARLGGIVGYLESGKSITIEYKLRRAEFHVRWVGSPGTRFEQQAGVELVQADHSFWPELPEEQQYTDTVEIWRRRPVRTETIFASPPAHSDPGAGSNPATPVENAESNNARSAPQTERLKNGTPTEAVVENLLSTVNRAAEVKSVQATSSSHASGIDAAGTHTVDPAILPISQQLAAEAITVDAALALIAAGAQRLLSASGAAIALPENGEMVCRANSGRAPKIGVRFYADGGLTGEAVSSGCTITCNDTLRDPRMDADVWRRVGIRSAISSPIPLPHAGTAVIEVFAAVSNAFTVTHSALLQELAGLVRRVVTGPPTHQCADRKPELDQPTRTDASSPEETTHQG